MTTHNNSLSNLCRGVGERVLFTKYDSKIGKWVGPIKPKLNVFEQRLHHFRDKLVSDLGYQSPVTHDQFVDFYKGHRRLVYQRAVDGLALMPFRPRDAKLKTFVKCEKIVEGIKVDPVPRVIQPRDPRYNVELGKFLRPLEKKMYASINNLFQSPTIMSEFNAYTQAKTLKDKWDMFTQPVCVGLDASRFDQHVSVPALRFEHSIYNSIFKSKELRSILELQIQNYGLATSSDGYFNYKVRGSRMSGDMNTSLGNKILMCLMCKAYIDSTNVKIELANNGDDCLLILERKHLIKLNNMIDYFKEFGFNIVTEKPVYEFEQIEFCQTKPVCSNGIYRMVRNVKICLAKDMTCVTLGERVDQYKYWLNDIGTCGKAIANDVPILGKFYQKLCDLGEVGNYQGKYDNEFKWYRIQSNDASCTYSHPDSHGRYSFWLSTGITPDEQECIESSIDAFNWGDDKRQLIDSIAYQILTK